MDMESAISCAEHDKPVTLSEAGPLICHQDGSYCGSEQFTMDTLSRAQAMALLIIAKGWRALNPPSSGDT